MDVMLIQNWHYQLLRTLVEAIAMVALGTGLIKVKVGWRQTVLAGLIVGLIGLFVQQLPIKYGVHLPIVIITFILTLSIVLNVNIVKSATAALLSFAILVSIEALAFYIQVSVFGYSEEVLTTASEVERLLFSLPPLFVLIAIAAIVQLWVRLRYRGSH